MKRDSPSLATAPVARSKPVARSRRFASSRSLTDWPSEADAPVARFVGFAPLSLTSALSDELSRRGVEVFLSQPRLFAVELAGSGEVQIVADLEQAGAEQEEGGDQIWVAADEAQLTGSYCFLVVTLPHPLPPPGAGGCGINHAES
jgi:hypothetical protein